MTTPTTQPGGIDETEPVVQPAETQDENAVPANPVAPAPTEVQAATQQLQNEAHNSVAATLDNKTIQPEEESLPAEMAAELQAMIDKKTAKDGIISMYHDDYFPLSIKSLKEVTQIKNYITARGLKLKGCDEWDTICAVFERFPNPEEAVKKYVTDPLLSHLDTPKKALGFCKFILTVSDDDDSIRDAVDFINKILLLPSHSMKPYKVYVPKDEGEFFKENPEIHRHSPTQIRVARCFATSSHRSPGWSLKQLLEGEDDEFVSQNYRERFTWSVYTFWKN